MSSINLKRLEEQVVVVFGASSGIGRLTAAKFAERGARVVIAARGEDGLLSLKEEIEAKGGRCDYKVADAENFDSVKAVADFAVELYGSLDTWVHVAGIYLVAPFESTTPEEFKHIVDVNLIGQAYGAMAALPHLRNTGGGALIHISSVEAKSAMPWQGAYAASKAGIGGFLDALRMELRKDGIPISVTNIMPAAVNTPFFSTARSKMGVEQSAPDALEDPEVVADSILQSAQKPARDVYACNSAAFYALGRAFLPELMDRIMIKKGFEKTLSNIPRGLSENSSFYKPSRDNRVRGDFDVKARGATLLMWMVNNPQATKTIATSAFLVVSWLLRQRKKLKA